MNKRTYNCPHCESAFKGKVSLIEHLRIVAERAPDVGCRYCPKVFVRSRYRDEHETAAHLEEVKATWRRQWQDRRRLPGNECKRCGAGFHCGRCNCCVGSGVTTPKLGQPVGYVQHLKSKRAASVKV